MHTTTTTFTAAILAATTVVGGVAAEQSDPPATSEPVELTAGALTGIWRAEGSRFGGVLLRFGADATAAFDNGGDLDTDPCVDAAYAINGTTTDFVGFGDGPCGCAGETWTWEMTIRADGHFDQVQTEEGCGVSVGEGWSWIRLSPESPAGVALDTSGTPAATTFAPSVPTVSGIWLREGSGQLLRFHPDGSYAIDDDGELGVDPDETGSYVIGGSMITFTSDGSTDCPSGETFRWDVARDSVRLDEDDVLVTSRLHATAADTEPACPGRPAGEHVWLLVSP